MWPVLGWCLVCGLWLVLGFWLVWGFWLALSVSGRFGLVVGFELLGSF
jgi:hypothetical protein